ncbi:carboxypeptidase regulatory-like domain protein [Leptospira yanagawae serovar Saopaulo str. Sao Paulo = ATCC 700523]|uniref:Carboxypeptidase regulatory-like domain protein n=1 Tax=Leptospira yanagawae serovar Saopaulo str. Sao Paulo = ATCC 700523 TaxID=1249483 RepID=A0A5E8HES2_9LEPT|nr:TonB-dependent receptor [Leptospira yanagawae]EOQ89749.1 carboxypeptidase regulatory-like domain protein [Leptospira yanagawae serovar Saopaulo str. Sao Paulo = ATCC 700523]
MKLSHSIKLGIITVLLSFPTLVFSQASGSIRGTIIDSENGEPVFGATIVVRSEKKFAKTDFDGKYNLELPPGTYQVEYQMYGYGPQNRTIVVSAGKQSQMNVTFGSQVLQTVEVKDRAVNESDAALLQLQKKAASVSDSIGAESIKKSPDSSAGEVVRRVTGITLIGGKYVFVRGLGERYSSTYLNDAYIPSTEPDKRVVPLDLFPASLIKNIRIIKTFVPEESAEFSGGLVKIETKEYPDDFIMTFGLGIGYNANTTRNKWLTFKGGDFFGRPTEDQKLPDLVNGIPNYLPIEPGSRFGGFDGRFVNLSALTFPSQWTPDQTKAPYDKNFNFTIGKTFKLTESGQRLGIIYGTTHSVDYRFKRQKDVRYIPYNPVDLTFKGTTTVNPLQNQDSDIYLEERLFGNNLNLSYEPKAGQQLFLKNFYSISSEKSVRDTRGQNNIDNFEFFSLTNDFVSRQLFNSSFGGKHSLNLGSLSRPHVVDWQVNYGEANRDEPNLTQQVWRRTQGSSINTLPTRLGNNPDGTRFYSASNDTVRSASASYEIPFDQWNGLKSTAKFGGSALDRFKSFTFREFGSKSNVGETRSDLYLVPGEIVYNPFEYLRTNSAGLTNKTFSERQVEPNAYDAYQKLHSYFGQVDMPLIPKLRFVGGARYEDSFQKVKTFVLKEQFDVRRPGYGCDFDSGYERIALINSKICPADNNGVGVIRTRDVLPSVNFVYEFLQDQNLRFGYTQTLTRPDFREMSPFAFTPYYGGDRIRGNPELKRTYIHNYDFRYEYFMGGANYIGAGVFLKEMSNPIELIGQPVAGQISPFFTYANASRATIRGVEFDFRREFFDRFRFETNFFFIKSLVNVISWEQFTISRAGLLDINDRTISYDPTNLSRPLQGQSDFVANLKFDVYLNKLKTTTIGLYYNYFGDRIFIVGANGTPDAYERGVGLTDIVFSHRMDEKLDFKFAAKNVTDQRFRIYVKDELLNEERLFRSYREGVSFSMSASYKF